MTERSSLLADLLALAAWSARDLANAINARLSAQGRSELRIDPTGAYFWLSGGSPRPPIQWMAASVLSERLGFKVDAAQLWPGATAGGFELAAASGFDEMTHIDDLLRELSQLATVAGTPLSPVSDASGLDLVTVVHDQLHGAVISARQRADREKIDGEQVRLISEHVAALRRLDDRQGGGALSVRYVTAQIHSIIDMWTFANYDQTTGREMLVTIADLAQLLGWLHFDSSRYGSAERYMLLSLGVCRALHDSDRAANVIGMLSYVSAFAGHGRQATHLAEAAHSECRSRDPILKARLLGREATAAAADGDLRKLRQCSEAAAATLSGSQSGRPSFLYYLTPVQLAAETGQALVTIADRSTVHQKRLLDEGIAELDKAVTAMIASTGSQGPAYARSGLLHSTFLAKALLQRGRNSEAIEKIRAGLPLLQVVQSPRGRNYLKALRPVLGRRSRSKEVHDFLPEFDAALLHV